MPTRPSANTAACASPSPASRLVQSFGSWCCALPSSSIARWRPSFAPGPRLEKAPRWSTPPGRHWPCVPARRPRYSSPEKTHFWTTSALGNITYTYKWVLASFYCRSFQILLQFYSKLIFKINCLKGICIWNMGILPRPLYQGSQSKSLSFIFY